VTDSPAAAGIRNPDLLGIYVNDHLMAATGGIELVGRMLGTHRGKPFEPHLERLLGELREEKAALLTTMKALGIPVRQYKQVATWLGEKFSRLKLNGRLLSRSPLSDLIEFEFIATAVLGKRAGFETLREVAEVDDRIDKELLGGSSARPTSSTSGWPRRVARWPRGCSAGVPSRPARSPAADPRARTGRTGGRTTACATTTTAARPHRPGPGTSPNAAR
jgi:hypothetical protein